MRICFIAAGDFPHIRAYLDYFKLRGHDVHLVLLSPDTDMGVPTYNVGLGKSYSETSGKWKYPLSMLRARLIIQKLKPDIVHAHYATSCGLTALVCGYHPFVVTAHGSDVTMGVQSKIWRSLFRKIFRSADCVNTVSDELRDMVIELGIAPGKIETLTLGIDTSRFDFAVRPPVSCNRTLRLVCTRRLEPVYDHPTILKACVILKEKGLDFNMTLIGDGKMRPYLENLARQNNLTERIAFAGVVENSSLPGILKEYDIYLSSSLRDGTSLCLLEAMAAGIYPIVSRIPANTAWLDEGVTGSMHAVGNYDELADAIIEAVQEPDHIEKAIKANRDRVLEKGDRNKNMEKLEAIYYQLIKR